MLENKSEVRTLESSELVINDVSQHVDDKFLDQYLAKVKSLDIAQIKIYMGVVYFLLVSLLSISLFF